MVDIVVPGCHMGLQRWGDYSRNTGSSSVLLQHSCGNSNTSSDVFFNKNQTTAQWATLFSQKKNNVDRSVSVSGPSLMRCYSNINCLSSHSESHLTLSEHILLWLIHTVSQRVCTFQQHVCHFAVVLNACLYPPEHRLEYHFLQRCSGIAHSLEFHSRGRINMSPTSERSQIYVQLVMMVQVTGNHCPCTAHVNSLAVSQCI